MQALSHRIYRFDDFELDAHRRQLLCGGRPVTLQPKAVELLVALVEHGGQLLTKDDLLEQVWPGQIVEESNLTVHMSALRKALGQRKGEHRFVVTVPGQGYRFVADVVGSGAASDGEYSIESHEVSRIVVEREEAGADEYGHAAQTARLGRAELPTPAGPVALFGPAGSRRVTALILGGVLLLATGVLAYKLAEKRGGQQRAALPPVAQPQLQLTRLTTVGGVLSTAVSPDGNYFVYAISEGDGQSLWVRQVSGARSIQIVPPEAVEYWGLTFSPDGTQVYASVFLPNETDTQFRRVPALGGVVERLPDLSPLSSIAFSPDGRRFAYVHTHAAAGQSQIEVADADGTNARKLAVRKQPAGFEFPGSVVSWSPDGKVIACVARATDAGGDYMNVVGVSVADGAELPLTSQRWAEVGDVAWLPDGSHLVVVGNEKPASPAQVWLLAYPEGRARQVTNDLNAYGWVGVTADSQTLLLVQRNSMSGLWVADGGQKEGEARQIGSEAGGYGDLSWTPDGRVVYRSRAGGDPNLWIVDAGGTNPRQLTTGASIWPSFAVTPDGRHVVFASPRGGRINLWRVGLDGGGLEQLTDGEGEVFPTVSPDSRWVVYQSGVSTGKPTVRKVPIEGGPSLPAIETLALRPEVSPDGKYVAYFYMEEAERAGTQWRIGVASLEDGSLVKFFRIAATARVRRVRWTPDGEALTYVNTVGGAANVWRQPFAGGPPRRITNFGAGQIETFAWSPDGKYLAAERPTLISDVTLLSDFR